jgi:hypothetical protein
MRISTQENFPRTEMFPKIPLLKINFNIFSDGKFVSANHILQIFLSVENFPDQENSPQQEHFVKCDWPTQIFRGKKILKLKIFNL